MIGHVVIQLPSALVLYDPTDVNMFGGTGQSEANAVANHRGIPAGNVQPLPAFGGAASLRNIQHNGHVIIITHGNEGNGFQTVTLRRAGRVRVTAGQLARTLASAGLFANRALPYRFELIICAAASGSNTFARAFYDEVRQRVDDVIVKAPVGLASIATDGTLSVSYFDLTTSTYVNPIYSVGRLLGWTALQPLRAMTNRFSSVRDNVITRHNLLLHDWFFYPVGQSF